MLFRKVFFLFFGAGIAVGKVSKFLYFFEKQFEYIVNINWSALSK